MGAARNEFRRCHDISPNAEKRLRRSCGGCGRATHFANLFAPIQLVWMERTMVASDTIQSIGFDSDPIRLVRMVKQIVPRRISFTIRTRRMGSDNGSCHRE